MNEPRTDLTAVLDTMLRGPQPWTARPDRRWAHHLAGLFASSLDRKLAAGHSPEDGRLLAARAQALVSPAGRQALARDWANLLVRAESGPAMRSPLAPLNRERIMMAEPAIHELIAALRVPLPIPARGAAMASWLLRDGAGPVHNWRRSAELDGALTAACDRLDPWAPLASAG